MYNATIICVYIVLASAAVTKYYSLSGLNKGNLLLTVLNAEKSKIKMFVIQFLVQVLFLVCR